MTHHCPCAHRTQDADEDEDGAIVFEEWLVSYAKPKPVWKNLVLMAANTLIIFLLLQVLACLKRARAVDAGLPRLCCPPAAACAAAK